MKTVRVVLCIIVLGAITSTRGQTPLVPRHVSSDEADYIGISIQVPKGAIEKDLKPPGCIADNIIGLQYFGRRFQKDSLFVDVLGFINDENGALCADLTRTGFSLLSNIANGKASIEVLTLGNRRTITAAKTAQTSTKRFVENIIVTIEGNRIWVVRVSYTDEGSALKLLADTIVRSGQVELSRP